MKRLLILFGLFYTCATSLAQQQYNFTNYTQEQGLPFGAIRNMYKDTTGYIWLLAEEGVSRFDGYNFKTFRHNPDVSTSLHKDFTWFGAFPKFGDIYFGTGHGTRIFNTESESFTFPQPCGDSIKIFNIEEAKGVKDCYWVSSEFAIFRISKTGCERLPLPYRITFEWSMVASPGNCVVLFKESSKANVLFFDYQTKMFSTIKIVDRMGMEDSSSVIADVVFTGNNFYLFTKKSLYRFDSTARSFVWQLDLKPAGNFDYAVNRYLAFNDTLVVIPSLSGYINIFNIRTGEEKLVYVNRRIPESELNDRYMSLCNTTDNDGWLWMGTNAMGLIHYNVFTGELDQYIHEAGNLNSLPSNFVSGVLPDKNGVIWAGCFGHGLTKLEPVTALFKTAVPTVRKKTGSSGQGGWHENIRGFVETDDGYWIATLEGLFSYSKQTQQFRNLTYLCPVSARDNNGDNADVPQHYSFASFAKDQAGNLWIATWYGELVVYNARLNRAFPFHRPQPLKDRDKDGWFRNLFCDSKNRMWISTQSAGVCMVDCNALNLEKINETKFEYNFFDEKDSTSLAPGIAFVVAEDADGNIWAGTENGLCKYNGQTKKWKRYYNIPGNEKSIHNSNVRSMCIDKKGILWIGTNGGGLNRYNKEQDNFIHFTTENGLPDDQIYTLVCDDNGMLWMGTNHGLCRFNPQDQSCKNFTEKDGIQNYEYNTGAALKLKDGTLLFGGVSGYNIIDPNEIENKRAKPPVVVITSFKVFGRETPVGNNSITLNYNENNLAFEFAALSYFRNQDNQYAYMLEGIDHDWVYSDTRRFVSYPKLEPGDYTFKVKACNSDGVWNETGAQLKITITPPWWKTTWAYIVYVILILGSVIGYNRYRMHALRARQKELEQEVDKATVIIRKQKEVVEAEKKRSDELLLNILPEETAEELKAKGTAGAKGFDQVTVLFTDFKDFTQASEKMSAHELVQEINYYFCEFDKIISMYNIEKIKTIGDSYMCAGGLPVPNKTNAEDVVRASLEICEFMKQEKRKRDAEGKPFFEIRIGCHTGSVVAGIVGIKKFAYDIWGDTVNIASRMESSSEAGKINISGSTYELVKDNFRFTYRGKIQAKNKGEIDMYFVDSIA